MIKIIECPRDAMQGIKVFIPTKEKAHYINQLLQVGFDTLDFTSFVSPKTIPQMRDAHDLMKQIDFKNSRSKHLAIIVNFRGAEDACSYEEIDYVGYPFSISETFQKRNANTTIEKAFETVKEIQTLVEKKGKTLVIYFSMAFGNPYKDEWNIEILNYWAERMYKIDVKIISLADTVGVAQTHDVQNIFTTLIQQYPAIEFGAHFHTKPYYYWENLTVAYQAGCRRFDAAIKGFGGCPMAEDELIGNIPTEKVITFIETQKEEHELNMTYFESSFNNAIKLFGKYQ
ncbi:MAG: hydroxymethylglutaryl-CoA lyase [Flavobacteriales bacterium]